ncbi:MAG: tetratricopeptide repeat protein [bacterium]|nr:tetratricopeptide repeat protein [bacterium]MDT8367333.1 tetratricopeptide repeat protein [bacterium]
MRRRFPVSLRAAILAACLILALSRSAGAGEALSRGVSDLVFHLTTYDANSRLLQQGQGLVVGPRGVAIVSMCTLEGAASAVATMMDGSTLSVVTVHGVDEISGLANIGLQPSISGPSEQLTEGRTPQLGERIIFSDLTARGEQVCVESVITATRVMPDLAGLYYVETSRPVPPPGGGIFGSDGALVGMVVMRFGNGHSGFVASNERVRTLAVGRGRKKALDVWSRGKDDRWDENPYARYMGGHAALWQGQPEVTLDLLEDHVGTWSVLKAEVPALLGEAYLALDLLPEAIMALKASVGCGSAPCWAYQKLAWAYMETGKHGLAEAACREVIRMEPASPSGYLLMAHLNNLKGDRRKALYEAKRALKRKPDCSCSHYERGLAYVGLARYEKAIESFLNATILDPQYAEAFNYLGYAYLRTSDPVRAVAALEEAVRLQPEMTDAWDNLGEAYSSAGFPDKTLIALGRSVCLDLSRSNAYCRLSKALMKQGQYSNAAQMLQEGLDRCEESQWLVYYLGKAFCMEGRIDLAREQAELLYRQNKELAGQLLRIIDLSSTG